MKRAILLVLTGVLLLMQFGCGNRFYDTRDECIENELKDHQIQVHITGQDSELFCYATNVGNKTSMQSKILSKNKDGKWGISSADPRKSSEWLLFYSNESNICYWENITGSQDRYVFIEIEQVNSAIMSESELKNFTKDNMHSEFIFRDFQVAGVTKSFFIARIPANEVNYSIQIGNVIIRDLDLTQSWNQTKAKAELVEDAGGLP